MALMDDLRTSIDAAERELKALRDENRELCRLLARTVELVGKTELTFADQEQLRMARERIGRSNPRDDRGRCHYCDAEEGEFHRTDCPVRNFESDQVVAG